MFFHWGCEKAHFPELFSYLWLSIFSWAYLFRESNLNLLRLEG